MQIEKKEHKSVLFSCFFEEKNTMQGPQFAPKEFPLEDLAAAGSAKKKLMGEVTNDEQGRELFKFTDTLIEFVPAEVAVLKKIFDAKKQWAADLAEAVLSVKDLFEGKK